MTFTCTAQSATQIDSDSLFTISSPCQFESAPEPTQSYSSSSLKIRAPVLDLDVFPISAGPLSSSIFHHLNYPNRRRGGERLDEQTPSLERRKEGRGGAPAINTDSRPRATERGEGLRWTGRSAAGRHRQGRGSRTGWAAVQREEGLRRTRRSPSGGGSCREGVASRRGSPGKVRHCFLLAADGKRLRVTTRARCA
jgi:hypothetical protein